MTETGSKRGDRDERRGRCTIAKVLLLNLSRFIKFTVGAVYFRGSVRAESILIGMGGTRTRPRDAREKRNKQARRRNIKGSTVHRNGRNEDKSKGREGEGGTSNQEDEGISRDRRHVMEMWKSVRKKAMNKGREWEGRKSDQEEGRLSRDQRVFLEDVR
ncbi:uncharacterized protein [Oscarella lobularis]|uniref:uncharacterized protein isoform X3 n=1 Tax=Oscarella lobularis TaxID=121494 RepID=UPI0033136CB8